MNIENVKVWKLSLVGLGMLVLIGLLGYSTVRFYSKYKRASVGLEQASNNMRIYAITVKEQQEKSYETRLALVESERKLNLSQEQEERLEQQNIRKVRVIGELELAISAYKDSLPLTIRVDTVYQEIPAENLITVDSDMGINAVKLPVHLEWSNEWATSFADINARGMGSTGFKLAPIKLDLVLGSRGVFRKEYISAASTNNPYVKISENSFQMVDNKRRAWPYIATTSLGLILGLYLGGM